MTTDYDLLADTINHEWISRYGGEKVIDLKALQLRVRQLGADRDCWLTTFKATEKDRLKLLGIVDQKKGVPNGHS